MTNSKITKDYNCFVENLYHCINRNANLDDIAQLVLVDSYCKFLCNKVAWKYHVDSAEIHAQLILEILENKILENVTDGSQRFNGRYFQWRVINIAKRLQPSDTDELSEELASEHNLADEVIEQKSMVAQFSDFNLLKQTKINDLASYIEQITHWQRLDLDELSHVIELSTENIARKLNIPRHKLVRHPEHYKESLKTLVSEYMALVEHWFEIRYSYLNTLAEEYGSLLKVYQRINLDYSYSKFAELANNMTLWQLEEIRLQLEQC